jgi:hypothetical protein
MSRTIPIPKQHLTERQAISLLISRGAVKTTKGVTEGVKLK